MAEIQGGGWRHLGWASNEGYYAAAVPGTTYNTYPEENVYALTVFIQDTRCLCSGCNDGRCAMAKFPGRLFCSNCDDGWNSREYAGDQTTTLLSDHEIDMRRHILETGRLMYDGLCGDSTSHGTACRCGRHARTSPTQSSIDSRDGK